MAKLKDVLIENYVTCCGLGHAPVASGTFGTLGGVAIAAVVGWTWPQHYLVLILGLMIVISLLGVACGRWSEHKWGRKDPGQFVIDEVAGYLVAVALPVFPGWPGLIAGFFLFRLFDIFKPWPARRLEKLPSGWGIVVDDLVAGAYALLALVLLRMALPELLAS